MYIKIKGEDVQIDSEDADFVASTLWRVDVNRRGYKYVVSGSAQANTRVFLHKAICARMTETEPSHRVDHKNGDTLDCRRENLRPCSQWQNQMNRRKSKNGVTSKFKGVHNPKKGGWKATVGYAGKRVHLGYYRTEEDAARAYDSGALFLYGEFAKPNFSDSVPKDPATIVARSAVDYLKGRFASSKGVSYHEGFSRYHAYITINQKRKHLGSFDTFEQAMAARVAAEQRIIEGLEKSLTPPKTQKKEN